MRQAKFNSSICEQKENMLISLSNDGSGFKNSVQFQNVSNYSKSPYIRTLSDHVTNEDEQKILINCHNFFETTEDERKSQNYTMAFYAPASKEIRKNPPANAHKYLAAKENMGNHYQPLKQNRGHSFIHESKKMESTLLNKTQVFVPNQEKSTGHKRCLSNAANGIKIFEDQSKFLADSTLFKVNESKRDEISSNREDEVMFLTHHTEVYHQDDCKKNLSQPYQPVNPGQDEAVSIESTRECTDEELREIQSKLKKISLQNRDMKKKISKKQKQKDQLNGEIKQLENKIDEEEKNRKFDSSYLLTQEKELSKINDEIHLNAQKIKKNNDELISLKEKFYVVSEIKQSYEKILFQLMKNSTIRTYLESIFSQTQ